jgi:hypothetical protein
MPQPRGSSDHVRELKNRAIAATYAPRQGISLDSSTMLAMRTGRSPQVVQPIVGMAYDVSGCCCIPAGDVNAGYVGSGTFTSNGNTYDTYSVTWDDIGASEYVVRVIFDIPGQTYLVEYDTITSATVFVLPTEASFTIVVTAYKSCGNSESIAQYSET